MISSLAMLLKSKVKGQEPLKQGKTDNKEFAPTNLVYYEKSRDRRKLQKRTFEKKMAIYFKKLAEIYNEALHEEKESETWIFYSI